MDIAYSSYQGVLEGNTLNWDSYEGLSIRLDYNTMPALESALIEDICKFDISEAHFAQNSGPFPYEIDKYMQTPKISEHLLKDLANISSQALSKRCRNSLLVENYYHPHTYFLIRETIGNTGGTGMEKGKKTYHHSLTYIGNAIYTLMTSQGNLEEYGYRNTSQQLILPYFLQDAADSLLVSLNQSPKYGPSTDSDAEIGIT